MALTTVGFPPQGGGESSSDKMELKAAGEVTTQTTSNAYDIDFADIAFTAGELNAGDRIIVVYHVPQAGTGDIMVRTDLEDTTSNPTGVAALTDVALPTSVTNELSQSSEDNAQVMGASTHFRGTSTAFQTFEMDSGDANIFTTAFTLRLNSQDSGLASDLTWRYWVYIARS
jgi:hypothetical protein